MQVLAGVRRTRAQTHRDRVFLTTPHFSRILSHFTLNVSIAGSHFSGFCHLFT